MTFVCEEFKRCKVDFVHVHCACGMVASTSPCALCAWRTIWRKETA